MYIYIIEYKYNTHSTIICNVYLYIIEYIYIYGLMFRVPTPPMVWVRR